MKIPARILSVLSAGVLLAACGGADVNGTYGNTAGTSVTLSSGTAELQAGLVKMEMKYTVDGDKIKLHGPAGGADLVLTRHSDGTLDTPWGPLKKK